MQMIITSSNDKLIGLYACTVEARHNQAIQFKREREHSRLDLYVPAFSGTSLQHP